MSLLMDALKKAEQAKQQGQPPGGGERKNDVPLLELEPIAENTNAPLVAPAAAGSASLPELPSRLEILDDEFIAHAAEAGPRPKPGKATLKPEIPPVLAQKPVPGGSGTAQSAAQNVFTAKQAPAGNNKSFAIVVGSATLVAVVGIGFYFWLQLQPPGSLTAMNPPPAAPRPTPLAAVPQAAAPVPMPLALVAPSPVQTAESGKPAAAGKPGRVGDEDEDESKAPAKAAVPPALTLARPASPPISPESPIRITASKLKLNPALAHGFDALSGGNLAAARIHYEQVLKEDPRSADALHGMASIALREGRPDAAETYYLRAIETDPKDALALAGLVGLKGQGAPLAAESHLKNLLAGQPNQPALHFALGNLYARQNRWSEAQQSYFRAVSHDPDHPDYLFNLAISLDQLRQGRLAAQYYQQALAATAGRPAGFDKAQAETRLRELQP